MNRKGAIFATGGLVLMLQGSFAQAVFAADSPELLDSQSDDILNQSSTDLLNQKSNDTQFNAPLPNLFPDTKKPDSQTSGASTEEQRMMTRMQNIQYDTQMRMQVQQVATWLTEYGMRNHGNFPGVETGDAWGAKRNACLQLTELVGSNPYGDQDNIQAKNAELSGLGPGLAAFYHSDGTPVTGSPTWDDEWTNELAAENQGRVNLQMDYGLSPGEIDAWKSDPPSSWAGNPGSITAVGNNQGMIAVWGYGSDGQPLKDSSGKQTFIVSQRVMANIGDQNAPNEDQ